MQLVSGVHQLPLAVDLESGERTFHLTAVETEKGLILLDTGLPSTTDVLTERLHDAGFNHDDIAMVLLTHHDGDHAGGLDSLLGRTTREPLVYAHTNESPYISGTEPPLKGNPEDRYPPVPVDVTLTGGERFRTSAGPMELVNTPGHSPGHLSAFLPEARLLIAADALTAEDGVLQGPNPEFTLDIEQAYTSVERLAELDINRVLCYHGGLVETGSDRIREVARNRD